MTTIPRKALWHHRFIKENGTWTSWELREVDIINETKNCYKISYKWAWWIDTEWIFKVSERDKIEFIEKKMEK